VRIDRIAQDAGRTPRTVTDQIRRAREDRDLREARSGLWRDAFRQHFNDLLGAAEDLQGRAREPSEAGLLSSADRRTNKLVAALRRHIPRSGLWKATSDWEKASRLLISQRNDTKRAIVDCFEAGPKEKLPEADINGFRVSIFRAVESTADGNSIDREYKVDSSEERPDFRWNGYTIGNNTSGSSSREAIKLEHARLVKKFAGPRSKYVGGLRGHTRAMREARDVIDDEVEDLILRRVLSGECALCPIPEARTRRRRRKTSPAKA
jgi:hypothetical protein